MPPALPPVLPERCPNCDAAVHGPFCAQCGQETVIAVLRLKDFSHEYFQHFVTLESRLWRTLWTLVRYPGLLTTEFLAGRRRRYVRPLPLYISLSFALFLLMSFFPTDLIKIDGLKNLKDSGTQQPMVPRELINQGKPIFQFSDTNADESDPVKGLPPLPELEAKLGLPVWLKPMFSRYYDAAQRWNKDPQGQLTRFLPVFQTRLPYAVFALVPLFAVSTSLLFFRRKRGYAEHFLFALHLHAFVFMTMILTMANASQVPVAPLLYFGWMAYLTIALRRWMGGRWWPQVLRSWVLVSVHGICLSLILVVAMVLTLPTV